VTIKLQKRQCDFFISYGHADAELLTSLVDWLSRTCGVRLWFDGTDGNAAARSSELISAGIGNSRGVIFVLSDSWKQSTWCKGEFELALSEQRADDSFEVVTLRVDDADPPPWFKSAQIIDFRDAATAHAHAYLLRSLNSRTPHRLDNTEDIYLASPWSRPSVTAKKALAQIGATGWRLVGDSPDAAHQRLDRIARIVRTTRGVVAILPFYSGDTAHHTSPYILEEVGVALSLDKPLLLLAEPGVSVPEDIARRSFSGTATVLGSTGEAATAVAQVLEDFDDELRHQPHAETGSYIFYAGSLLDAATNDDIGSVIESASNMRCVRGDWVSGHGETAQQAIINLIRQAAMVIADVTDDNRNTLIETGIAMGSGVPLRLMSRTGPDGVLTKRRFMYEGQHYQWYRSDEERLGLSYRFAHEVRRQIYVLR
jgi:TIR domain